MKKFGGVIIGRLCPLFLSCEHRNSGRHRGVFRLLSHVSTASTVRSERRGSIRPKIGSGSKIPDASRERPNKTPDQ